MSSGRTAYLRAPRRASEIVLGLDGRALAPEDVVPPVPAAPPEPEAPEIAEAALILERAQAEAEAVVAAAAREAAAIAHEAYREGREQGYQDGVLEARGELADALALVQRVGREARAVHDRVMRTAERELIELVIDVARSVIGAQVALQPTLVIDTVERALARAGAQNVLRVRVHEGDQATVSAAMATRYGEVAPFAVLGDHAIAVGGCVIDTEAGEVDARLDVQLDEIARLLRSSIPDDAGAAGGAAAGEQGSEAHGA